MSLLVGERYSRGLCAEMGRRQGVIRAILRSLEVDVLVIHTEDCASSGAVRWLFGVAPGGHHRCTILLPVKGEPTFLAMDPEGASCRLEGFTVDRVVRTLRRLQVRRVAIDLSSSRNEFALRLAAALPEVSIFDASGLFAEARSIRTADEISLIQAASAMTDDVFAIVCEHLRPGMCEADLHSLAQTEVRLRGGEDVVLRCDRIAIARSRRSGGPEAVEPFQSGDCLVLRLIVRGVGGVHAELARSLVLGQIPPKLEALWAALMQVRSQTLSQIRAGANAALIAAAHDAFSLLRGLPVDVEGCGHGIGYDPVERPILNRSETMVLSRSMCLTLRSSGRSDVGAVVVADTYVIGETGLCTRLQLTPQRIFAL